MIKVYDIETMVNCFTYTDYDPESKEINEFVISEFRNDHEQFCAYLNELKKTKKVGMVGFNNLFFDWPIVRSIMLGEISTAEQIYYAAQTIIKDDKRSRAKQEILQLDLFLMNHYDNKSRSTSLKALETHLGWDNVMDMPFDHRTAITPATLPMLLEYNRNDVLFTARFYELCREKIDLRKQIGKKYKLNVMNSSDVAIGETIFLKYLATAMGTTMSDLNQVRGKRTDVYLSDIIFPYIEFEEPVFKDLLRLMKKTKSSSQFLDDFIKSLNTSRSTNDIFKDLQDNNIRVEKIAQQKKSFSFTKKYNGIIIDYGVGGIHGCAPSGEYVAGDKIGILDIDVKSYYPNLFIHNRLHPRQMDQRTFLNTYKEIFAQRVAAQKEGDQLTSDVLKLALNGVFGKTGSDVSPFYDPHVFYSITVNGQLLISMLVERLVKAGCELLQVNTDGVTVTYTKTRYDRVMEECKKWETKTGLTLEYADYDRMFIRDVNNYIAVRADGKVKEKGVFETKKEWHKDNSYMVVPKAVREYLVNKKPVEEFLREHDNLLDFCGRYKASKGWHVEFIYLDGLQEKRMDFGKIYRFLPVSRGGVSMKINADGREHHLCQGSQTLPFNKIEVFDRKNLNYRFLENECYKLIETIYPKQLSLI